MLADGLYVGLYLAVGLYVGLYVCLFAVSACILIIRYFHVQISYKMSLIKTFGKKKRQQDKYT
jgi:cytochrome c oxidase subunit IV